MNYLTVIPATASVTCIIGMEDCDVDVTTITGKQAVDVLNDDNICAGHPDVFRVLIYKGCEVDSLMGADGAHEHEIIRALETDRPITVDEVLKDYGFGNTVEDGGTYIAAEAANIVHAMDAGWVKSDMADRIKQFNAQ